MDSSWISQYGLNLFNSPWVLDSYGSCNSYRRATAILYRCSPPGRDNMRANPGTLCAMLTVLGAFGFATAAQDNDEESLVGIVSTRDSLVLSVISNGCTKKKDFTFQKKPPTDTMPATVLVVRAKKDVCRRMPFVTTFEYSLRIAGLQPGEKFFLVNSLKSPTVIRRK